MQHIKAKRQNSDKVELIYKNSQAESNNEVKGKNSSMPCISVQVLYDYSFFFIS